MKNTNLHFILLVMLLIQVVFINAQPNWCWAEDALAGGNEEYLDVATDPVSNNNYAVGYFNGDLSAEFPLGVNNTPDMSSPLGNQDGLIVKYDALGNFIWAFKIGAIGESVWVTGVAVGSGGDIFIAGYFNDRCDFGGVTGSPTNPLTSGAGSNEEIFLAKYDANGFLQWVVQGSNTGEAIATGIATNGTNVYITGWFENNIQFDNGGGVVAAQDGRDIFFVAYDQATGTLQWDNYAGDNTGNGFNDLGYAIAADNNGVYSTGTYRGTLIFNGGPTQTSVANFGIESSYIVEMNPTTGVITWLSNITSNGRAETRSIAIDPNYVFLGGGGDGNVLVNGFGPTNIPGAGALESFVCAIDRPGKVTQWVNHNDDGVNNDIFVNDIAVDTSGNVYATGAFHGTTFFNNATVPIASTGNLDIFVSAYKDVGTYLWTQVAGDPDDVIGKGISIGTLGGIQVVGLMVNEATFGSLPMLLDAGGDDAFIAKLNCTPCGPTITTCVLDTTMQTSVSCDISLPNYISDIAVVDGCANGYTVTQNPAAGTLLNPGIHVITLVATDVFSNADTCQFNITVVDTVSPLVICPNNIFLPCPSIINNIAPDSIWDNCLIDSVNYVLTGATIGSGLNDASGIFYNDGSTTVTYTITDTAGNTSSCAFTISITDNTAPAITCPANIIQACPGVVNAIGPSGIGDNCSIDSVNYILTGATTGSGLNDASGIFFNFGVTTVTYTVTDLSGNTTSCNFTVTISDNTPPTISCPTNLLRSCPGVVNSIAPSGLGDNCGIDSVHYVLSGATSGSGLNDASGTYFNYGVTTITYTITDVSGNTNNCSFTIAIIDNTNPNLLCPLSVNMSTDPGLCSALVNGIAPTIANDNCAIDSINYVITGVTIASGLNDASGTIFNIGTSTIQYTITDSSGNSSTCNFTVTVNDDELPTIACPGNILTPNDASSCSALVNGIAPFGLGDNCGIDSVSYVLTGTTTGSGLNDASGTVFNVGVSTVTYFIADVNGNVDSCSFMITVVDSENPQITCPAIVNTFNDTGVCNAIVSGIAPVFLNDNCGIDSVLYVITGATSGSGSTDASGTSFNVGVSNITYYVYDLSGNVDSCDFDVIVLDTVAPFLSCPGNIVVNNDPSNCSAVVNGIAPIAVNDNCAIDSISYQMSGATVGSGLNDASGNIFNIGSTSITYIVFDVNGNGDSCTFTVDVTDNELPIISCPSTINDSTDAGLCSAVINGIAPLTTSDNCGIDTVFYNLSGASSGTGSNDASGTAFNIGATLVRYFIVDVNGNIDSCSLQVNVVDAELPTITCGGNLVVSTDTSNCSAVVNSIAPISFGDNCSIDSLSYSITGATSGTGLNDASGTVFNVGLSQVMYTVVDSSGNVDSCSFTVLVDDNEAPIVICPANVVLSNDSGQCGALVSNIAPINFSDNCSIDSLQYVLSGATIGNGLNDASGVFFNKGLTLVNYIIYDVSGNVDSCSFSVTINDSEEPSLVCPSDIVLCDTNVTVPLPIAGDNCGLFSVLNDFNGTNDASGIYPFGVTTVQYTTLDSSGNPTTCEFTVEVEIEPIANAGEDQVLLGVNTTKLNGSPPNVGNGNWTNTGGYGVILNGNTPNSPLLNLDPGVNTFLWTVSNGTCPDAIDEVKITYIPLIVPSGFSPNGDGDNDYFVIDGIETVTNQLTIFNRWGVELFDTFNYENDWDGRSKSGVDLPEDTYFYVLKILALDKELSGFIVLKR